MTVLVLYVLEFCFLHWSIFSPSFFSTLVMRNMVITKGNFEALMLVKMLALGFHPLMKMLVTLFMARGVLTKDLAMHF